MQEQSFADVLFRAAAATLKDDDDVAAEAVLIARATPLSSLRNHRRHHSTGAIDAPKQSRSTAASAATITELFILCRGRVRRGSCC